MSLILKYALKFAVTSHNSHKLSSNGFQFLTYERLLSMSMYLVLQATITSKSIRSSLSFSAVEYLQAFQIPLQILGINIKDFLCSCVKQTWEKRQFLHGRQKTSQIPYDIRNYSRFFGITECYVTRRQTLPNKQ